MTTSAFIIMLTFVLVQPDQVYFINSLTLCLTTIHPVIFTSIEYLGYGILYHPVLLILINLFTLLGRASKNLCGHTSLKFLSHPFLVPITFSVPVVNVVTYLIQQFSSKFFNLHVKCLLLGCMILPCFKVTPIDSYSIVYCCL